MNAGDAGQQEQLKVFRRLIDEGFSGGNIGVVDEVCAEDYFDNQLGHEPANREGLRAAISFLHRLSPDIKVTVEEAAVIGDRVWARLSAHGGGGGEMLGAPTGRAFDITVMDLCRFRDGKIVEHWGVADRLAQMQQLGVTPGATQPSVAQETS